MWYGGSGHAISNSHILLWLLAGLYVVACYQAALPSGTVAVLHLLMSCY
jgi:hypothetical protein